MAGLLFALDVVVATPAALELLEEQAMDSDKLLVRHVAGDWGDLGAEDRVLNEQAIREGLWIFSAYDLAGGRL